MPESDLKKQKIFCSTQKLRWLTRRDHVRDYLSGEQFLHPGHPELVRRDGQKQEEIWQEISRAELVKVITADIAAKRFAVVCSAGLGKSTNLKWLAFQLAGAESQHVPFLFHLDKDEELPDDMDHFWETFLPEQVRRVGNNRALYTEKQIRSRTAILCAQGRLVLLLDSIDQATEKGQKFLSDVLREGALSNCAIVVSARPHAIYDQWKNLIDLNERSWRFIRIEPLEENERKILLNHDGVDRYSQLPDGGRDLMANPRNIEFVLEADKRGQAPGADPTGKRTPYDFTLRDFKTASHLYAGAVEHLVRTGFISEKARTLGMPENKASNHASLDQIELALDLLSALAYTMYCRPGPKTANAETNEFRPNVSHVGKVELVDFKKDVVTNLRRAGIERPDGTYYNRFTLTSDIEALAALNNQIHFDMLDSDVAKETDFRWYNRTLQEFFAARWLSRFCDDKDDLDRLRNWRYADEREASKRSLYEPLWGYLVEMPPEVRPEEKHEESWAKAVGVLFEHNVTRSCEMIHRSWLEMEGSELGRKVITKWQQEFPKILKSRGANAKAAREIIAGFRRIRAGTCQFGADPLKMEEGEAINVGEFYLHEWPVTNLMYEVFDPLHKSIRWGWGDNHPLAEVRGREGEDYCPAVRLSWFDAWCMAHWVDAIELEDGTKVRVRLPEEKQWEHACRAGTKTTWWFKDESLLKEYAWHSREIGGSTKPVGTKLPAGNELYDMYGNAWEWCFNRYDDFPARVVRGGAWSGGPNDCRSAFRLPCAPEIATFLLGFRLAAVRR